MSDALTSTWRFLHERWLEQKCSLLLYRQREMVKDWESRVSRWQTLTTQPDQMKWRRRLDEEYRTHVVLQGIHGKYTDLSQQFGECLEQCSHSGNVRTTLLASAGLVNRRWDKVVESLAGIESLIRTGEKQRFTVTVAETTIVFANNRSSSFDRTGTEAEHEPIFGRKRWTILSQKKCQR